MSRNEKDHAFEHWQDEYCQTSEYIECRTVEVRKAWDASWKAAAENHKAMQDAFEQVCEALVVARGYIVNMGGEKAWPPAMQQIEYAITLAAPFRKTGV